MVAFAKRITRRGVTAAAMMQPGYTGAGVTFTGTPVRDRRRDDKFRKREMDSIAAAIARLKAHHGAERLILVGHSAGAIVSGVLLGRTPDLADAAVLVACPGNIAKWRRSHGRGPGIKAYVVHLLIAQMLSLKRVAQSMHALIGRTLSEATLLGYLAQLHHALAEWERRAIEHLLVSPAMHIDETSLRVDRKNHWIHVYSAGTLTVKCLHPKRGCEAIEAIGILPRYAGVAVHDCWASYLSYAHCDHALCGAHLLRELAFIVDAHGYAWAKRMKRLLLGACHQVSKRDDKTLTPSEYKALQKRYRTILTQGARELPPIPPRQNGQRGKVAKSDAHNLWERMQKHEIAVLRFAKHPDVAFTNNRAERDLRMAKVKQKVSGCFRTRKYAEAYCRISSYLQSMANQGYNPLVAIQIALAGRAVDNMGE